MSLEFYYSDKDLSKFPNQKILNNSITGKKCLLQSKEANPLTIRLLVADDALSHLKNEIKKFNDEVNNLKIDLKFIFINGPITQTEIPRPITTGSAAICTLAGVYCSSTPSNYDRKIYDYYPNERILTRKDDSTVFRNIIAHMDLFSFFSNYGSVLDRFAHEMNILFDLQIKKIDWLKLIPDKKGNISAPIKIIRLKYPTLFLLIDVFQSQFGSDILKYRNRIIHDGLLKFKTNTQNGNLLILLQKSPEHPNDPFRIDGIDFCEKSFLGLLDFLDHSYNIFLQNINTYGQPPWK